MPIDTNDLPVYVAAAVVVVCSIVVTVTLCFILSWIVLYYKHAKYKIDAAAKRKEAALAQEMQIPAAFKFEQLKHANSYHPQFLDTGSSKGHAFHFDTLLTYSNGHANLNNNSNVNVSET